MKYIIMCGGSYGPNMNNKCLFKVAGESLVERTIRLLREFGIEDISVSTNDTNDALDFLDVNILKFKNSYVTNDDNKGHGYWCDAFYYTDDPVCYLMGDVFYSKAALKKILDTEVKDSIRFFGTDAPYAEGYFKKWQEPLAFKVVDQKSFHKHCDRFRKLQDMGPGKWPFCRRPISWELAQVISNKKLNTIIVHTPIFIGVHEFAVDIDSLNDIPKIEAVLKEFNID